MATASAVLATLKADFNGCRRRAVIASAVWTVMEMRIAAAGARKSSATIRLSSCVVFLPSLPRTVLRRLCREPTKSTAANAGAIHQRSSQPMPPSASVAMTPAAPSAQTAPTYARTRRG